MRSLLILIAAVALVPSVLSQTAPPAVTVIRAGVLIDGNSAQPRRDQVIVIRGNRIESVSDATAAKIPAGATIIDLSHATVLPGLIDSHTHIFLQGEDPAQGGYDANILKYPLALRAARATVSARRALEQGFTTLRDLETEGAGYGDVGIKEAIEGGYIPGPRLFVVTRAISTTGGYNLEGYAPELDMPKGAQIIDGPVEARKAAREQLDHGADWIKVYMTHRSWVGKNGELVSQPTLTVEELKAIVDETHGWGKKVACHAYNGIGLQRALDGGCDSIEHGLEITDAADRADGEARHVVLRHAGRLLSRLGPGRHARRSARPRTGRGARGLVPEGVEGGSENCLRHRHRRHPMDGTDGAGVPPHGRVRHGAHGNHQERHFARRRDAGYDGPDRRGRARRLSLTSSPSTAIPCATSTSWET